MVVVPDVLRATFSAMVDDHSGRAGLAALERAGGSLTVAISSALPAAQVHFYGFRLQRQQKLKSRSDDALQPTVTGHIDIPLAAELSFWGRARLVTALCALTESAASEAARQKPKIHVRFAVPVALVANPEARRLELMDRWFLRINEISACAQKRRAGQAIRLQSCSFPGPVQQRSRSLMEVELRLDLEASGPLEVFHGSPDTP